MPPPMTPRDHTAMIGNTFYTAYGNTDKKFQSFYNNVRDPLWPDCLTVNDFKNLPAWIQQECTNIFQIDQFVFDPDPYTRIVDYVLQQGNIIKSSTSLINGAMVSRIGKDLYFGTTEYNQDTKQLQKDIDLEFTSTRNHIVNTGGHSDGTYCPVSPGLIISLKDVPTYQHTYPGWEVIYLQNQSWERVKPFLKLKEQNKGKWWIPGFEYDQDVINTVETWLTNWVGYVEETVFDVNMLIVDPKNVIVFNYNKQVFDALERYSITPHIVTFRHRYFWDGGIHCITSDLHREGFMQNYFLERG
jgi:hypothetical protein